MKACEKIHDHYIMISGVNHSATHVLSLIIFDIHNQIQILRQILLSKKVKKGNMAEILTFLTKLFRHLQERILWPRIQTNG